MRFPGVLPLVFFLFLVPAIVPIIEKFWPTNTTWWSALLVAVLGAAASAIWLIYRKQLDQAGMPPTEPGSDFPTRGATAAQAPERSKTRQWLLG